MQREYEPELGQSAYNDLIGSARKIIETTFSVLTRSFNANWAYARSITGLVTARQLSQQVDGRADLAGNFDCQLANFK